MEYTCKLSEVEELINKICEEYIFAESEVEDDITAFDYRITIPALGIYIKEGIMFNEDGNADFGLTLIYDIGSENYDYFEQDPVIVSLINYLHFIEKSTDRICNLDCIITFDSAPELQ